MFAPSEEALRALPEAFVEELRADKDKLREFLVRGFNKERIFLMFFQIDFLLVIEDDGSWRNFSFLLKRKWVKFVSFKPKLCTCI